MSCDSTEQLELTKPFPYKTHKRDSRCCTILLFITMLLAIVVLVILPPALSQTPSGQPQTSLTTDHPTDHNLKLSSSKVFPTVTVTNFGDVRGVYENGVRAFHGVPFAQPPLGDLRWRPPQPAKPWHPKTLDATKKKAACLQNPTFISPEKWVSEDCLYLEIYAPIDLEAGPPNLPVLFYIHGGAYESYSAKDGLYDGSSFALRTGAIVVVAEYRLGTMGFLVHGTADDIRGNYGLLDQAFALKWVHENIAAFGGDPHKVTLSGQSAGAQSAIVHLMSKETSKMFRSIILESPPVPLPVKTFSQGFTQTTLATQHVNCPADISEEVGMKCLRNASVEAILRAQKMSRSFGELYLDRPEPWGPVEDNKLVHGPLLSGFQGGNDVPKKPIMWGVTSEEALIFIRMLHARPAGYLMYVYAKIVFEKLGMDSGRLAVLYPVKYDDSRNIISNMFTDFLFRCPAEWAIGQVKKFIPSVWTYVFEKTIHIPTGNAFSMCSDHACHSVNIPYMFNTFKYFNISETQEDMKISEAINHYYGNFLWYGNPNGKLITGEQKPSNTKRMPYWPRSYEDENKYQNMVFQGDGTLDIGGGVRKEKCEFWYNKFP